MTSTPAEMYRIARETADAYSADKIHPRVTLHVDQLNLYVTDEGNGSSRRLSGAGAIRAELDKASFYVRAYITLAGTINTKRVRSWSMWVEFKPARGPRALTISQSMFETATDSQNAHLYKLTRDIAEAIGMEDPATFDVLWTEHLKETLQKANELVREAGVVQAEVKAVMNAAGI